MKFKIALLQYEIKLAQISENLKKLESLAQTASDLGAQAIIVPELFNCGYVTKEPELYAESFKGRTIKTVAALCVKNKLEFLGGSIIEKKEGHFFNTSFAMNSNGELLAKYRKVHLFNKEIDEISLFSAGDEWCVYPNSLGNCGLLTCFDLRFPAFIQNLSLRGANILVNSAQWPAVRLTAWRTLNMARALENECFVIACNACGKGAFPCAGHSMLIAPTGEILCEAEDTEGVFLCELDTAVQGTFEILSRRKAILDEIDENLL